ncbi:MAG: PDDEXK nuclease domain-containing protein [Kiritimatiellae bacterium]|jgi:predicted nuclease of restriction endonuclease-like (RecB) superfamily|nr:PDDEXK nuclease domain-containing protein [Kiritimatiellia bacterium]
MKDIKKTDVSPIVQQAGAQTYDSFVGAIKERIRTAQVKAALAANAELVLLYWDIGSAILKNQKQEGWGAKVIDRLSADLKREFPKMSGYSVRNLKYMRTFVKEWPDRAIVHQLGAQIPWKHNCVLLDRLKDAGTREFYIRKTLEHGWSRSVLIHQLDSELHKRAGKAPSNFALTLPAPNSDLAQEMLKDPFIFKPAPLDESAHERALENALIVRLKDFLIELGDGFAFLGNQYRLEVDGDEFFLDLLFYHARLHCYVVIDLKVVDFKPEYVGKMNFYQTAVDEQIKMEEDGPTIGLILCRGKNKTVVEYTLRDSNRPVAVAEYRLLPPNLKDQLPDARKLKQIVSEVEVPDGE